MRNCPFSLIQSWLSWPQGSLRQRQLLSVGLLMGLGFGSTALVPVQAQQSHQPDTAISAIQYPSPGSGSSPVLDDGTYLYGESAQPDQMEMEYVVFQVRRDRVTGAFYMPRSGFDCFAGNFAAGKLDVTFSPSDWQPGSTYTVPLNQLYPLRLGDNDQRILNSCLLESEQTASDLN